MSWFDRLNSLFVLCNLIPNLTIATANSFDFVCTSNISLNFRQRCFKHLNFFTNTYSHNYLTERLHSSKTNAFSQFFKRITKNATLVALVIHHPRNISCPRNASCPRRRPSQRHLPSQRSCPRIFKFSNPPQNTSSPLSSLPSKTTLSALEKASSPSDQYRRRWC